MKKTGVYETKKKDGSVYYRTSVTINAKHISLGSYAKKKDAENAYKAARKLLESDVTLSDYDRFSALYFEKFVILLNLRDNHIYFPMPVYLKNRFFYYYLDEDTFFIFDREDLFYYTSHKIQRRGGHLFVSDFGMQVSLLSRYDIRPYAVEGRDYRFRNGNNFDLRRENIEIINPYIGVIKSETPKGTVYTVKIHVKGNYTVGTYSSATEAAIAYNKAADILKQHGIDKNYGINYVEGISAKEYAEIYSSVSVSKSISEAYFSE